MTDILLDDTFMDESVDVLSKKKRERLDYRLQIAENQDRILRKDITTNRAVMEEVFDKSTLMTVYHLLNQNVIEQIVGTLKSGKESRIYYGLGSEGERIAIKIYLTTSSEFRKGMLTYLVGDPRYKVRKRDSRSLTFLWTRKEFENLHQAYSVGIRVPQPIHFEKNVLVMEFIGEDSVPAPTLKEKAPEHPEKMYGLLLEIVRLLYREAKLIHSDLSEYNIMHLDNDPILFDMSQSVRIEHPLADKFLLRDLNNLNHFFKKNGVKTREVNSLYKWVTGNDRTK